MIALRCPNCSIDLTVDAAAGAQVQCGGCGFVFPLPDASGGSEILRVTSALQPNAPPPAKTPRAARQYFPVNCPRCGASLTGEQSHCDRCGFTFHTHNENQAASEADKTEARRTKRRARIVARIMRMFGWAGVLVLGFIGLILAIPFLILAFTGGHIPFLDLWQWGLFISGALLIFYALSAAPLSYWFPQNSNNDAISNALDAVVDPLLDTGVDREDIQEGDYVRASDIVCFLLGIVILFLAFKSL
jgi:ribosomal protein S27E